MKNFELPIASPRIFSYLFPLIVFVLFSCEPDADVPGLETADFKGKVAEKANTFYGPAEPYGRGVVRSFVTIQRDGSPLEVGLKVSDKVFEHLPDEMHEFSLKLPNKAENIPFDHIDFGWMPGGHPPEFYLLPHFDIHFYMISEEEKMQITDENKAEILPHNDYWPATYFPTPGYEPYMGKHWLSANAPELGGETFTHTFIYGSYDGDFIFYEPMITLDYFNLKQSNTFEIPQPAMFEEAGYYPTTYSVNYDRIKKETSIILGDFVYRQATD
ncbi:DUF5602 domain-containing protein [Salegentibacter sp. HM20]